MTSNVKQAITDAINLLAEFKYESDEDSGCKSFFEAHLNEDWFFHVKIGLEKAASDIESLTRQLAAYEAHPVVAWIEKLTGLTTTSHMTAKDALRAGEFHPLIRKPTSTEHLELLIAEAVAKNEDALRSLTEVAVIAQDLLGYINSYVRNMVGLPITVKLAIALKDAEAIRARAQKG